MPKDLRSCEWKMVGKVKDPTPSSRNGRPASALVQPTDKNMTPRKIAEERVPKTKLGHNEWRRPSKSKSLGAFQGRPAATLVEAGTPALAEIEANLQRHRSGYP